MLKHLFIQNFVLIDELNLDLESGFSAFTGETGAGKSILIDAISVLRADRASSSMIAKGKEKAIIEGTFDLTADRHACKVMEEAGLDLNDETTFTRELHANGKSTARIDHRIVTLSLMKNILRDEIDIHGQRDNAYLLNSRTHLRLLDEFLQDDQTRKEVSDAYHAYDAICKERDQVLNDTYNENDLEYFKYEISEIEEADLHEGEDEELEEKEKQYKAVKDSFDKLNSIFSLYDDSVSTNLYDLNKMVQSLKADASVDQIQSSVNDAYYSISDAMDQLHALFDDMDLSEEDVNAMEERIFTIQKLKRKYGRTIPDILAKKEELEKQVQAMTHRSEYLEKMNRKADDALSAYQKKAAVLSRIRKEGTSSLDQAISENLKDLKLPNARFETKLTSCKPSEEGNEKAEFMISMNKGEDLKPLNKTASGGELSRLMLGLKVIFTKLQGIQTVIFDEIDTGVSGPVATAIGRKMKKLSDDCQVFAVTHLAQVAACADHNYLVAKSDDSHATHTSVRQLNEKETIDELALIASGEITDASRKAAQELLSRNHQA